MILPTYKPVHNWRGETNKCGRYLIHIRITIHGQSKYDEVPLPLKVATEEWCEREEGWVLNTHPFAFEINQAIREKLDIIKNLVKRYYTAKKSLTFPIIFKELQKNCNSSIFNEYYENIIKDPPEALDDATLKRYRSALAALNKFNPEIAFHELSEELFQRAKKYLLINLNLVGSTTNGYFNAYKKVIYWARLDHHITKEHEESIFENVTIKIGKAKKDHLEVEEIQQWKTADCTGKYHTFERDRDMFLLLIYTGYYYSDLRELYKSEIRKDPEFGYYLYSGRFKNDSLAIIPLWKFPDAVKLIEKYRSKDPKDPYLLRRDCFICDQVFNRRIKIIAKEILGWDRPMKNKLGRTTNAQLYIRFGANRPIVSKMLGHDKEETTSDYYAVNLRDVIEGVKDVNFEKLGI